MLQELLPYSRMFQVNIAGQNEVEVALLLVKAFHHVGQQAQDAAGTLEGGEGTPLFVQDVNDVGMEGVGHLQLVPVAQVAGFGR